MASDDEDYHSAPEDASHEAAGSLQNSELRATESKRNSTGDTKGTGGASGTQESMKDHENSNPLNTHSLLPDRDKNRDSETTTGDSKKNEAGSEGGGGSREEGEGGGVEYVSGLDNRYVSEDHDDVKDKVELTEEQMKELKEQANKLKANGNESFKSGEYEQAVEHYSEALKVYPPSCVHEIAVCYANRAACHMKKEAHQNVIDDCTKALELEPQYLKAILRRAQAHESLEKYEDALEDYKKALEIDPSQSSARQAVMYLPDKIKEQQEKLKEEMIGKLKELGNVVLKPFGLSTDNFQLQQDPQSGGYSVNFKR